jgi:hypothetical protein
MSTIQQAQGRFLWETGVCADGGMEEEGVCSTDMKSQEKTTQKQKKSSQKGHILCENDKKEG